MECLAVLEGLELAASLWLLRRIFLVDALNARLVLLGSREIMEAKGHVDSLVVVVQWALQEMLEKRELKDQWGNRVPLDRREHQGNPEHRGKTHRDQHQAVQE
ncbi:unnamed protein product, partial [Strongylus vulgaris]